MLNMFNTKLSHSIDRDIDFKNETRTRLEAAVDAKEANKNPWLVVFCVV